MEAVRHRAIFCRRICVSESCMLHGVWKSDGRPWKTVSDMSQGAKDFHAYLLLTVDCRHVFNEWSMLFVYMTYDMHNSARSMQHVCICIARTRCTCYAVCCMCATCYFTFFIPQVFHYSLFIIHTSYFILRYSYS